MTEIRLFEVDHPDSQREKRAHIGHVEQRAREVKFVAVDFTRDNLAERLEAAGDDPSLRTTWTWEGVVMYLTLDEVAATLRVIAARSAASSRLVIVYIAPGSWIMPVVALVVRRFGEPFRSHFRADEMKAAVGHAAERDDSCVPPAMGRRM